jgi:hypothetical protein
MSELPNSDNAGAGGGSSAGNSQPRSTGGSGSKSPDFENAVSVTADPATNISTYRPGLMDLFAGVSARLSNSGQFRLEATQSRRVALPLVKLV